MSSDNTPQQKIIRAELTHEQETELVPSSPLSQSRAEEIQKRIDCLEKRERKPENS